MGLDGHTEILAIPELHGSKDRLNRIGGPQMCQDEHYLNSPLPTGLNDTIIVEGRE